MSIDFPEGTVEGDLTTLHSPGHAVTLRKRETIVREGWPSAFRSATERVWLHLGVELDRHLQGLSPGQLVSKISYSWSEVERYTTHAVLEALVVIDMVEAVSSDLPPLEVTKSCGMVE